MSDLPSDPRSRAASQDDAVSVIDELVAAGYATALRPGEPPGSLRCTSCASVSSMSQFDDVWATRLEGASDPDDMVLVVAGRCPVCGDGGNIVLGFGPASSAEDAAIVAALPSHSMHRHMTPK